MGRFIPLLALTLIAPLLPACSNTCTLVGCGPAVLLVVGSDEAPLDPSVSTYQIDIDLEGQYLVVTCTTGSPQCEVEGNGGKFWVEAVNDADRIEIEVNGGEDLAPALIEVYLLADEAQIHESSLSPQYTDEELNGQGCGVCRTADEAFVLPGS